MLVQGRGKVWVQETEQDRGLSSDSQSDTSPVPDIYADGLNVSGGYAGFTIQFTRSNGDAAVPVGIVRLSPQQTFVLVQILRKMLQSYERDIGKIPIPKDVFEAAQIEQDL